VGLVPDKFSFPTLAVVFALQHSEVLPVDEPPGNLILNRKVRIPGTPTEREGLLVNKGDSSIRKRISDDDLRLRPHSQPCARSVNQARLKEDAALGLWKLFHLADLQQVGHSASSS